MILGSVKPAADTLATLYARQSGSSEVTILVCNQSTQEARFSIAIKRATAPIDNKHYIFYNTIIAPNDTLSIDIELKLGKDEALFVSSTTGTVSFNAIG